MRKLAILSLLVPVLALGAYPGPVTSGLVGSWPLDGHAWGYNGGADGVWHGLEQYTCSKVGQGANFNGSSYVEVPDSNSLSPSTTGEHFTACAWLNPANFTFTGENEGYVNWLGKGTSGNQEWTFRMYNGTAQDPPGTSRAKRVSFYAFNLSGGNGAGSYFQDNLTPGQWIFVCGSIDGTYTRIYKNGALRDQDLLSDYNINMGNGTAPMRFGTRDQASYLQGAVDGVRIWNRTLTDAEIQSVYNDDLLD